MCEFAIEAIYCCCKDRNCEAKGNQLGDTDEANQEHMIRVVTCLRTQKRTCTGMFTNNNPNRRLVRYGMGPNNSNSKQDCRYARYVLADKTPEAATEVCRACVQFCDWKGSRRRSEASGGAAKDSAPST